jgi:hypothetical protein
MLEHLSSINWSDLSHAYGPADDVPQLLRDLASPTEEMHGRALGTLYTTIYHQGTVYQASAYAVPFLIDLLQQEQVPERDGILGLLAVMAKGDAYHRQHLHLYDEARTQDPAFQQEMAEGISWVERTYAAINTGVPLYLRLLEHQDIKIRLGATHLLGNLSHEATQFVSTLCDHFDQEQDQRMLATILLSIGTLMSHQDEKSLQSQLLLTYALDPVDSDMGLVRVAAAMALIRTRQTDIPIRALDVLLDTIAHPEELTVVYEELPWAESRLVFDAIRYLYALPLSTHEYVLPRLIPLLASLEITEKPAGPVPVEYVVADLAPAIVDLAFGERRETKRVRVRGELTDLQRAALTAIVQSDPAWKWHAGTGSSQWTSPPGVQTDEEMLFEIVIRTQIHHLLLHGLPDSREELRAFLGLEPQEKDTLHLLSRRQNVRWTPREQKQEVLGELMQLNPHCAISDLKMLVGIYS